MDTVEGVEVLGYVSLAVPGVLVQSLSVVCLLLARRNLSNESDTVKLH